MFILPKEFFDGWRETGAHKEIHSVQTSGTLINENTKPLNAGVNGVLHFDFSVVPNWRLKVDKFS